MSQGMRNIDEAGYTMAKSAVVTLTRSFAQRGRNGPWRLHGIKAFALCPWFADTQLVRDAKLDLDFVNAKAKQRTLSVSEVNVDSFTSKGAWRSQRPLGRSVGLKCSH